MFDVAHIHPMLVHFPIALAIVGCSFEFIALFIKKDMQQCKCGEWLLYLATVSAVASVLSGLFFTGTFAGKPGNIRDIHMLFAAVATMMLCITSIFYLLYTFKNKDPKIRMLGFFFYVGATVFVALTGAMGGTLVYKYMIGL